MSFWNRLSNGWRLGMESLSVIRKNKQLVLFPIISGVALIAVVASFVGVMFAGSGFDFFGTIEESSTADYLITFVFYLVAYFVIVFFNMGLVHCTRIYLQGGKPSFNDGVRFSMTRLPIIMGWAILSATVGLILKAIEENGTVGEIVSSIIGVVWSVMTFFVVPVLAYEGIGPIDAVKRSTGIMRKKWGESIGASFSFGIVTLAGILLIALPIGLVFGLANPVLGVTLGIMAIVLIQSIVSAAEMVFIASVYHQLVMDQPIEAETVNMSTLDDLFISK